MKMNFNELITKKRIMFFVLFAALVLVAKQINFSAILGAENQAFTLFQFFGPIAGSFLGPVIGAGAVLIALVSDNLIFGKAFDLIGLFRLTPMIFAAIYFGLYAKKKFNFTAVIPLLAMIAFIIHPIGQQVWYYSLYWLIPVIAAIFTKRLFFRSLGATFTAHAIGSVAFLYAIPTNPELWMTLIPIVAVERILFALGISVSFIGFNTVLAKLEHYIPKNVLSVDKRYTLAKVLGR